MTEPASRICFGTGPLGCRSDGTGDRGHLDTLEAAYDGGVRDFDTAPSYGDGEAERLLGLAASGWERSAVRVSGKVGRLRMAVLNPYEASPSPAVREPAFDFDAAGTRRTVGGSLARLRLDRLDTVYLHDPDEHLAAAADQALPELRRLQDEGLVGRVGVATTDPGTAAWFVERGLVDVVMLAGAWGLVRRTGRAALDLCHERTTPVVAAAPFASGWLASSRPREGASYFYGRPEPEESARITTLTAALGEHGVELAAAALQFPLRHPAVHQVAVGMAAPTEVVENLARMRARIDDARWDELDSLVVELGLMASGGLTT